MPGLSQLKKFNADILSLGNEPGLRASRGEKPVTVPIPKGIEDVDDSDDFITGMPEPVEYDVKPEKAVNVEEDFSDIMGTSSAPVPSNAVQPESTLNVPDLSSLADLGAFADSGDEDSDMMGPDLSMFADPIEETEPEPEPEPEEPEISDLSLEDLLGGMGFDGSEGTEEKKEDSEEDSYNIPDDASHGEEINVDDIISQAQQAASVTEDLEDADEFDALLAQSKQNAENNQFSDEVAKDDFAADDFSFGDGNESIKDGNFGEIDGSELDDIGSDIDALTSEGNDFSDVNDSDLAEVSEIVDSEAAEQISDLPEIENEEVVEENPDFTENDFNREQQAILDAWDEENRKSCERGTKIHADLENSFYKQGNNIDISKYQIGGKFTCIKDKTELDIENGIYPEYLISWTSTDGKLRVAGQIDLLVKKGNSIVIGDWKGLPLDTEIPTLNGWSTIAELKEGDYIFDKDGNPTKILHKSDIHHNPCYKITFDNGKSIVADHEHRWLISFKKNISKKRPDGYEHTVMTTEEIYDYLNNLSVIKNLRKAGTVPFEKPITFLVGENGIGKSKSSLSDSRFFKWEKICRFCLWRKNVTW